MATVIVQAFRKYDIRTDEMVLSGKLGTEEAIKRAGGEPLGMAVEVDESELDRNGFVPMDREAP